MSRHTFMVSLVGAVLMIVVVGAAVVISFRNMDWAEEIELRGVPCVLQPGDEWSVFLKLPHTGLHHLEIPLVEDMGAPSLGIVISEVPEGTQLARTELDSRGSTLVAAIDPLWIQPGRSIRLTIRTPESGEAVYLDCQQEKTPRGIRERPRALLRYAYDANVVVNAREWSKRRVTPYMPFRSATLFILLMIAVPVIIVSIAWILISR